MKTLIIAFIIIVLIVAIFCVFIVLREIVIEEKEKRIKVRKTTDVAPLMEQISDGNAIKSELASTAEIVPIEDDRSVKADATKNTLDDKYLQLEEDYRLCHDEIAKIAAEVENNKRLQNDSCKVAKNRIILLRIKRRKNLKKNKLRNSDDNPMKIEKNI